MSAKLAQPSFVLAGGLAAAILVAAPSAHADRRAFTHTYEYMTQPKGGLELEFYNTQESETIDTESPSSFGLAIETEYGITDHWDIALYQVFGGTDTEPLVPEETTIETRLRLAERGEWPVDVLLYLEVFKPFAVVGVGVEPKLVLARDFGKLTAALNLVTAFEPEETGMGTDTKVEYEFNPEFALGVTYELAPSFKLGAETWGNFHALAGDAGHEAYAGPALSWAPSPKVWTAATAGFGVVEDANDFSFRFAIGLAL